MSKLDLKKELKEFYRASANNSNIIEVAEGKFITITGRGAPGGPAYTAALNALYSVACARKDLPSKNSTTSSRKKATR